MSVQKIYIVLIVYLIRRSVYEGENDLIPSRGNKKKKKKNNNIFYGSR
jgi:hypothetical protein